MAPLVDSMVRYIETRIVERIPLAVKIVIRKGSGVLLKNQRENCEAQSRSYTIC